MGNPITDYTLRRLCGEACPPSNIVEQAIAAAFDAVGYGQQPPAPIAAPAPAIVAPAPVAPPPVIVAAPAPVAPPPDVVAAPPAITGALEHIADALPPDDDTAATDDTRKRKHSKPKVNKFPDGKSIPQFIIETIAGTKPGGALTTQSFMNLSTSRYKVCPSSQTIQRGMHACAAAGMVTLDYYKLGQPHTGSHHAPGVQMVATVTTKATQAKAQTRAYETYKTLIGKNAVRIGGLGSGDHMARLQSVARDAAETPASVVAEREAHNAIGATGADAVALNGTAPGARKAVQTTRVFKSFNALRDS
ncbi:MAG: hypothetical protein ACOYBR_09635 [Fluviibacter sp.]